MSELLWIPVIVHICIATGVGVMCLLALPLWLAAKLARRICPRLLNYLTGAATSPRPIRQRLVQSVLILLIVPGSGPLIWFIVWYFLVYLRYPSKLAAWDQFHAALPASLFLTGMFALGLAVNNLLPPAGSSPRKDQA